MRNRAALVVVAVVAGSLVPQVGGMARAGTDDGTPGIAVESPTPAGFTPYGALRFRSVGSTSQGDEYLGVADLGVGTNRIESNFGNGAFSLGGNPGSRAGDCEGAYNIGSSGSPASNVVIFTWNKTADTLTTMFINPTLDCTMVFGPGFAQELASARGIPLADARALLEGVNALQVFIDDREAGNTIDFTGVAVDRFAIGPFIGAPGGQRSWLGTGYDFDAPNGFTIAGTLRLAGAFGSCNETCKLEIQFGNLAEATDGEGPITTSVVAMPNPVAVGGSATVTANVDDSATGGSNIGSAEVSLDAGATWAPMAASDGAFDQVSEDVTADLDAPGMAGAYDLCVRGTDVVPNTGAEACTPLIVYDPNGGFVTGGGWIDSPEGAYEPDPELVGRANFGFVSRYGKDASVPEGSTEFRFRAGDLNFHSDVQEWLVVDGNGRWARFEGVGTVNGAGSYGFGIRVRDASPDTFRIRIWDEGAGGDVVYDSGVQALGGGSVVVHTK